MDFLSSLLKPSAAYLPGGKQDRKGKERYYEHKEVRGVTVARLHSVIDGDGQRLGDPGDVPGHHEGCPEFAGCPGEGHDSSREYAPPRKRQGYRPYDLPLGLAEEPCRVLEVRADAFQCRT